MQRTGVPTSVVPSRDCDRPRPLAGETSSTLTCGGLAASPCIPVDVPARTILDPNGRPKLKPSLVGVPALCPLISVIQNSESSSAVPDSSSELVKSKLITSMVRTP